MSIVDEVKQKTDIVEVIGQYVSLKKAGRNLTGLCPFHSEKNPSFFVFPERQSWHCFGCNTGGDALAFVIKKEGIEFPEALRLLAERAGINIPLRSEPEARKGEKERLFQVNEASAQYFHHLLLNSSEAEKVRNYLKKRELNAKTITDFQLGFSLNSWDALKQHLLERGYAEKELLVAGLISEAENGKTHDRFRNKLMFPISDSRGRVTGFGARVLDDSQPKYFNSPQTPLFDKSGSLYGINLAATAIRKQEAVVIVEGYMDVIAAHQNGFNNVVAAMGTSITEKQVTSLKKLTRNVVLALDADAAGEEAMLRGAGYENVLGAELRVVILPKGKDPDDVIKENGEIWRQLTEEALPIIDYNFNMVTANLDLSRAKDKSIAAEKLIPVIAAIKDFVRRDHYLLKLTRLIGVSYNSIEATLKEYLAKSRVPKPKRATGGRTLYSSVSSALEEYFLTLLLQHPELKRSVGDLSPEYFESSENREIFLAWQQANSLDNLKEKLDSSVYEYLDSLLSQSFPTDRAEQRYAEYVRRMKERHLKNLEAKRAEVFASVAETGGPGADLAKLEEEGIEPAVRLREVFSLKGQGGQSQGGKE